HLAARENCRHLRMRFELLKFGVRIDHRVLIVETGHIADADNVILETVYPAAAVSPCVRRKSERMHDLSLGKIPLRHFPTLLYTDRKDLRLLIVVQPEPG